MLIIPAIDILGGKCVRLTEGVFGSETVYNEDPVAQAKTFEDQGAEWIHVVDLDGARAGRPVNTSAIERIVTSAGVKIQVGGGVRSVGMAKQFLAAGVSRVVVGSAMTLGRQTALAFFDAFGEKVAAGIDTREGMVAVDGWTGTSEHEGQAFAISLVELGCRCIVFTDITRDGKLEGPNVLAVAQMVEALEVPVIASGGVSSLDDLAALHRAGAAGAIVGKALYEGRFTLQDAGSLFEVDRA